MKKFDAKYVGALAVLAALALSPPGVAGGDEPGPSPEASPSPQPSPAPAPTVSAGLPIRLGASVTVRQDFTTQEDQTDLLLDGNEINGLRGRVRLWAESRDPKAVVGGRIRISAGEAPNPASPFVRLGDVFRPLSIGFDQFYMNVRPLGNRERLIVTVGKMPLPFWRGDRGTVRSELVWDDDISPVGAALTASLYGSDDASFGVDNVLGYFALEELTEARFQGIVGTTYLVADQLRVKLNRVSVAAALYDYENLNNGARAPNFTPGSGASLTPGTSAFLLRSGLQVTNSRLNLGPGAEAFVRDRFRILDLLAQGSLPIGGSSPGKPEVYLLGQYTHNFSVPASVPAGADGWGATAGFSGGAFGGARLHPFNLHFTYRDVDADATLGTFADSDLGAGTSFKGFEASGNYRLTKNLLFTVFYFSFDGGPKRDSFVHRLFLDLTWDF